MQFEGLILCVAVFSKTNITNAWKIWSVHFDRGYAPLHVLNLKEKDVSVYFCKLMLKIAIILQNKSVLTNWLLKISDKKRWSKI